MDRWYCYTAAYGSWLSSSRIFIQRPGQSGPAMAEPLAAGGEDTLPKMVDAVELGELVIINGQRCGVWADVMYEGTTACRWHIVEVPYIHAANRPPYRYGPSSLR